MTKKIEDKKKTGGVIFIGSLWSCNIAMAWVMHVLYGMSLENWWQ